MDIINYFIEMTPKTRAFVGILFVALASTLVAFVKSKLFQELLTGIFNWFATQRQGSKNTPIPTETTSGEGYTIKESDIKNHDFFNYVDFWLYNQIPSITLRSQYRTAVFRKYLHIYFKTYKNTIQEFIRGGSYKTMSSSELRKTLLNLITNITREMEMEMREINIPDVIIIKMKNVLNDRTLLTVDLINSICDSSFYDGAENYLKIYSFLNIIHSILDNTISNIEPVCNELNGELTGLSIDGFTEVSGHGKK
jgi:hypothetical protein